MDDLLQLHDDAEEVAYPSASQARQFWSSMAKTTQQQPLKPAVKVDQPPALAHEHRGPTPSPSPADPFATLLGETIKRSASPGPDRPGSRGPTLLELYPVLFLLV